MPSTPRPDPELLQTLRAALDASYEIEREIGGGMSRVFVATERALGRRVVIKVLPPELTADVNRERFRREIQFAARLQHPHIVPLLTAGQVGDILYYTMPLVEGETLRARLDREGRLPAAEVVGILQDVVDAIAYAHAQGLIHRDIKPENILLQRHHALVTDFGVAKAISEAMPGTAATTIGIAVGTPAYMAPEQLAADPAADHRIDLYAVGLLAYELLSGGSPFSGSSPQQTLARQMTERPTPPHIHRSDVPPDFSALIMRCLEKAPEARWSSAEALLSALQQIRITSSGIRATRMPPARRRVILGATLVLLLGAGLSLYAMLGAHRESVRGSADSTRPATPASQPSPGDSSPGTRRDTSHSVLTRADSEAIAAAFARRILERRGSEQGAAANPPSVAPAPLQGSGPAPAPALVIPTRELDSLRIQVEHLVADSVLRVLSLTRREGARSLRGPGFPFPPDLALATGRRIGGPARIVVLQVVDVSRERALGELATTLTDSLVQALRRNSHTQVLSGGRVDQLERQFGNDQVLGMSLGASMVLRGSLARRQDSLMLFVAMFDTREQRYVRSFRSQAPRSNPVLLSDALAVQIREWLDHPTRRQDSLPLPR